MSIPNKKNDGSIPESILNQLNEHTIGGFILFYFNSQNGEAEQAMMFDSPAHCLALQKSISDWTEALHKVNIDCSVLNIYQNLQEKEDGSEEE